MAGLGLQVGGPIIEAPANSITIVQSNSAIVTNSGSTEPLSVTVTLGQATSPGNQLICVCGAWRPGGTAWTCAQGNKWTMETTSGAELNGVSLGSSIADGVTTSFTFQNNVANTSGTNPTVFLMEVSGLAPSPIDHTQNETSQSAGVTTSTVTWSMPANTNTSSELVVYGLWASNGLTTLGTVTYTNCTNIYTGSTAGGSANPGTLLVAYDIYTTSASPNGQIAWSGSQTYEAGMGVSFVGSAPPGPNAAGSPGIYVAMPGGINRGGTY